MDREAEAYKALYAVVTRQRDEYGNMVDMLIEALRDVTAERDKLVDQIEELCSQVSCYEAD